MSVTMTEVILRSPIKILTTEPARSEFLRQESLTERLRVAHQHLSSYYMMHLEGLWPRNYREVREGGISQAIRTRIVFFRKVTRRAPSTVTPVILSSVDPS